MQREWVNSFMTVVFKCFTQFYGEIISANVHIWLFHWSKKVRSFFTDSCLWFSSAKFFCDKHLTLGENSKSISYWYSNTGTVGYWSRFHQKWTIPYEVGLYVNCCLWSPPTHPSNVDHQNFHKLSHLCLLLLLSPNDIELQEDWWKILIWNKENFLQKRGQATPPQRWGCLQSLLHVLSSENADVSHFVWFHLDQREKQKEMINTMALSGFLWFALCLSLWFALALSDFIWLSLSPDLITKALLLLCK